MSVSPPSIQFSPSLNRKQEVSNRPTEMGVDGPHSSMRRCWLAGSSVSPPQFPAFVSMRCGGRTTRVPHERTRVVGPQEQQRMCGRPTGKQQKKGARRWRQMTSPAWDDA